MKLNTDILLAKFGWFTKDSDKEDMKVKLG